MRASRHRLRHKHFRLDQGKIERAQRLLGARTETETVERALEEVIAERERNRRAWAAQEKLLQSGIEIADVYRALEN